MAIHLTRRQALRGTALGALTALLPHRLGAVEGILAAARSDRILVLLELEGGNDGLNTLVPYADATYQTRRTSLRLDPASGDWRTRVIPFSTWNGGVVLPGPQDGFGVHAALDKLKPAWQAGDLAFVHGVGYAQPNLSHFRGIDIWNTGADDTQPAIGSGWLGRMLAAEGVPAAAANTAAVIFRRENNNPAGHVDVSTISMGRPGDFLGRSTVDKIPLPTAAQYTAAAGKAAVLHLLDMQKAANEAHDAVQAAVGTAPSFATTFPNNDLGNQAKYVAQCIAGGLACPFYKMSIGSFDTHADQRVRHSDLLAQVADALRALREALIEKGRWDQVLVMTYAEFGRRIEENNSAGTDHGTAAPHILIGGRVTGGIHGTQPDLAAPDSRGNLVANTDFRRLYATCGRWLGIAEATCDAALDPFTVPAPACAPIACVDWS